MSARMPRDIDDIYSQPAWAISCARDYSLREMFPSAIWLEADVEGGRFLWAVAATAWPADSDHDANGLALPSAFPYLYRARRLKK